MPRLAPAADVFTAIAEPRRREIIAALGGDKRRAVGELVELLGIRQPAVSKHLQVLRKAGLVTVTKDGQHRLYGLNAAELKSVYEWAKSFERFWSHKLSRIKQRAERQTSQLRGGNL